MADPVQEYKTFIDGLLGWPRESVQVGRGRARDRSGCTALRLTEQGHHVAVVAILEKAGTPP